MLNMLHEMTQAEYHAGQFPDWIDKIPLTELLWEFLCNDQECEGAQTGRIVRVYRRLRKAA